MSRREAFDAQNNPEGLRRSIRLALAGVSVASFGLAGVVAWGIAGNAARQKAEEIAERQITCRTLDLTWLDASTVTVRAMITKQETPQGARNIDPGGLVLAGGNKVLSPQPQERPDAATFQLSGVAARRPVELRLYATNTVASSVSILGLSIEREGQALVPCAESPIVTIPALGDTI